MLVDPSVLTFRDRKSKCAHVERDGRSAEVRLRKGRGCLNLGSATVQCKYTVWRKVKDGSHGRLLSICKHTVHCTLHSGEKLKTVERSRMVAVHRPLGPHCYLLPRPSTIIGPDQQPTRVASFTPGNTFTPNVRVAANVIVELNAKPQQCKIQSTNERKRNLFVTGICFTLDSIERVLLDTQVYLEPSPVS